MPSLINISEYRRREAIARKENNMPRVFFFQLAEVRFKVYDSSSTFFVRLDIIDIVEVKNGK